MPRSAPRSPRPAIAARAPHKSMKKHAIPVELRSLMLLGGVTIGISAAAIVAWMGPWSPVALEAPAGLVASGEPAAAVDAWLALSESRWAGEDNRRAALWRATQVAAVELDAPERADRLAVRLLALNPEKTLESDILALRATLAPRVGDGGGAPALLVAAAAAAPEDDRRGALLLEAAQLEESRGELDRASLVARYAEAASAPSVAAEAQIHIGRLQLDEQPAAAYEAYARALQAAGDGPSAKTARLGMAAALERLEGRDAALAALDEAADEPNNSPRGRARRASRGR